MFGVALVAGGDVEAGGEALHVPFPGAGVGFVEVVDIEDQVALGRGEATEVQQVAVAAERHDQAAVRRAGQIVRLHDRRAAEERER